MHDPWPTLLDHEARITKLEASRRNLVDVLGINEVTKKLAIVVILIWMAQAGHKDLALALVDVLRP